VPNLSEAKITYIYLLPILDSLLHDTLIPSLPQGTLPRNELDMSEICIRVLILKYIPIYGNTRYVSIAFPASYADAVAEARTIFQATNTALASTGITLSNFHVCPGKDVELTPSSYEVLRKETTGSIVATIHFGPEV